jgi:heme A synthase
MAPVQHTTRQAVNAMAVLVAREEHLMGEAGIKTTVIVLLSLVGVLLMLGIMKLYIDSRSTRARVGGSAKPS